MKAGAERDAAVVRSDGVARYKCALSECLLRVLRSAFIIVWGVSASKSLGGAAATGLQPTPIAGDAGGTSD